MHLGQNRDMIKYFRTTGGKVILFQHAFDSGVNLKDNFWNQDMSNFDTYIVGCTQDQKWLSEKYPNKEIVNLGMPRMDDLYETKDCIEGLSDYFLVAYPNDGCLGNSLYRKYMEQLPGETNSKLVFKVHPGGTCSMVVDDIKNRGLNVTVLEDDMTDLNYIYKLINGSRGVICDESFLAIETSLLNKPVIFYGHNELPTDFYEREENVNQIQRLPIEMSSSLSNPTVTTKQLEICQSYPCDGKNTSRVIKFLKNYK